MSTPDSYADLEIRILERQDAGYPVEITLDGGQEFPRGFLAADILPWTSTGDLRTDGERLFAALIADAPLREAWAIARGQYPQRRVRLRLDTTAPELHALPWELLHDGKTWLSADAATPFSRYLPSDAPWGGLVTARPIRILAVIANPADLVHYNLAPLDVAAERALLADALGDLVPAHFDLEYLDAPVTLERLERTLASGPHVLHFVGHGAFNARRQEAALYLQDADGNAQIVTDAQLCDMLRRQGTLPSLVFLAACQSAERSTVDAFVGLAPRLVQASVPAVVAMQDRVAMAATQKLTPVFYEELARHGEVDHALNAARSLLLTGQSVDAATPVLLMRLKDAQLWEPLWAKTNPYRGLAAFTENDAEFFFGRESLIQELSDKVRHQRFIAVVGPSGSGKSSVVQAGLLLKLPKDWQVIKLRPGNDPYANEEWQMANGKPSADSPVRRYVIFIDQFEELFALCTPDVQTRFQDDVQALIAGAAPITVILTLRADFFGYLQNSPLGHHLEHALVNVLPMAPDDLRAAIANPAKAVGLRFEAGLVETIMEDAQRARHTLPLLQFALTQLWEQQTRGTLTYDAYVAAGRVAGAIGLRAEDTYNELTSAEQQIARRVFTRLVHYGEGDAADTRQRRAFPELLTHPDERAALHRLLHRLADARLATTGEAQGVESVEIIHDALLKEWPRLAQWLADQREFYLWRQRLETYLGTWEAQGRDDSALLRGALLAEAERWAQMQSEELNPKEQAYIHHSLVLRQREEAAQAAQQQRELEQTQALARSETRRVRNLRIGLSVAVLFLLAALGAAWIAMQKTNLAEQQAQIALSRQLTTQAQTVWDQRNQFPMYAPRAVLLAVESLRRHPESDAHQLLTAGLVWLPREVAWMTHEEWVGSVAFSPDGRWVVSGSHDDTARVWEAATGREVARMTHEGDVTSVAFSPDGQWVVSGGWDQTARVWEAATGIEVARMTHEGAVSAVAFRPDGRWVVSGSRDDTARVWEATTGREVARMTHEGDVTTVAFSPDERWVVSGSVDTTRVWEATTGREVARMSHAKKGAYSVTFSPDGRWVVYGSVDTTRVWNGTVENVGMMHEGTVSAVAFSPDGRWVVSGSGDHTARVWNVVTGVEVARMTHEEAVSAVAFSPDGRWVVSGSYDKTTRVWEPATGREVVRMTHEGEVTSVAFSPDGRWVVSGVVSGIDYTAQVWEVATGVAVAWMTHESGVSAVSFSPDGRWVVSGSGDKTARVWEAATGIEVARMTHEGDVNAVAFSPDGRWVVSMGFERFRNACIRGTARVWEAATGREVARMTHEGNVSVVAFSPDGQWVLSAGCDECSSGSCTSDSARVWEAATGAEVARMTHEGFVEAVAFSPNGRRVVSGSVDRTARVWEVATGAEVARMTHEGYVEAVAFSPDGRWVVSGSRDGNARVWEAATGREVVQMTHEGSVTAVAFSPDGRWVVSGSGDKTARVWEAATGREIARITHEMEVTSVAFSLDGRWVVSGSGDNTARVWEAATGAELARMTHEDWVTSVAFSPDGWWVVSGSHDGTARVWWWQPEDMIRLACERLTRNLTREEWTQYLGDEPYRATCPNLPIPEK